MTNVQPDIRAIFCAALDRQSPADVVQFLDAACGEDAEIRAQVEALLDSHREAGMFLGGTGSGEPVTIDRPVKEQPGTLIGPYKLLEQVGEGGMGLVYMAEQQRPVRRLVALKIIKPGFDSKQTIARFEAERQALAMMDHPNIAKVHDAGTTETGRPYFVMELVRGIPLNEFCDQKRLTVHERLQLFVQVCHAVQHAHQKGIIHRDLKPTNVLVAMADTVAFPKLLDFGIAKALGQSLTESTLHTGYSQLVGTPLYMSPEQAEMNVFGVDTRSDVYSLGVLLYELLTGTTPFDKDTLTKASFDEMRRMIREDDPPRPSARMSTLQAQALSTISQQRNIDPRRISTALSGELDWIVMKSLEKDRSRRYESASSLAADIQRYLSDEPVLACPPTTMYRFQKFARKHRPALAAAAGVAACLILGTTVSAWQAVRATTAEAQSNANATEAQEKAQEATTQRDEAKAVNEKLNRTLYAAHMTLAQRAWDQAALPQLKNLLDQHQHKAGEPDLRGFEWHYLNRLAHADAPLTLNERNFFFSSAEFSSDGKRLVTTTSSGTSDGMRVEAELKFWDSATGQELFALKGGPGIVAVSRDGNRLVSQANDNAVKVLDAQTGQELLTLNHSGVRGVAISADGKRVATGSWDARDGSTSGAAKVWDAATGQELFSFNGNARSLAFSPDGKRLAYGIVAEPIDGKPDLGTVKVVDAQSGAELLSLQGAGSGIKFSPDGKLLASSSVGGREGSARIPQVMKVWHVQTGQVLERLTEKSDGGMLFRFSPDSKRLAIAGYRSMVPRIKVCDTETGEELFTFQPHIEEITSLSFSPDSQRLASSSGDRTLRVFDLQNGQKLQTLKGHTDGIYTVAFSPDGQRLISAAWDGRVKVWDAPSAANTHPARVGRAAMSADFKRLATASIDNIVRIWDVASGKETVSFKGHANQVQSIAFSPDGQRVASSEGIRFGQLARAEASAAPAALKVWNAQTGQELFTCQGHVGHIIFVTFSPDGKRLASRSVDTSRNLDRFGAGQQLVKVWDAQTGRELHSFQLQLPAQGRGPYDTLAFSADGRRLAAGGDEVKVWDAQSGQELHSLKGGGRGGRCVAFSPDGKRLVGVAPDATAWIWDLQTGQDLIAFNTGHADHVLAVTFTPDGKRLATGDRSGIVKVWDSQIGQELLTFAHTGSIGSAAYGADRHSHNLAFSADGNRLASAMWDGSVRIWDATPLPEKP